MFPIAFYGVVLMGSLWGVIWSLLELNRGRRSSSWPSVEADIVDSFVKERFGGWFAGTYRFVPIVRYQYRWEDALFEGSRIMYAPLSTPQRADAEQFSGINSRVCVGLVIGLLTTAVVIWNLAPHLRGAWSQ